jgi:NAD(P)-dependent dehydrogenase (short-subunit alcohol dehydrogenase family)
MGRLYGELCIVTGAGRGIGAVLAASVAKGIEPHCFVTDVYAARVHKVFNITERPRKPNIHHHRHADASRGWF